MSITPLHEREEPQGCLHPRVEMVVDELGLMTEEGPGLGVSAPVLAWHHECTSCAVRVHLIEDPT